MSCADAEFCEPKEDIMRDENTAYYAALNSGIEITEDDKAEFRNVRLEKERAYEAFDAAARKATGK
jgi:hypothetical protein